MIQSIVKTILCFLLILSCSTVSSAENARNNELSILTENSGEDNHVEKDGSVSGYNVEIVKEIMKRLGVSYEIEAVPWARGYHMTLNEPNTMLFATTRIPEREKLFKWAGPLNVSRFLFYARPDYPKNIKNIDDAKNVTAIGCIAEDVRHKILLNKGFKNLEPYFGMNANIQNLKKLLAGRIDLWIASPEENAETARQLGIEHPELKEVLTLSSYHNYMAFSLKTPDEIVMKWQETLDKIKGDGTYEKIMSKYSTGPSSITFDRPGPAKDE